MISAARQTRVSILLREADIAQHNQDLAARLSKILKPDCVIIALLDGALLFAADLMRALHDHNIDPEFGSLRLSSYGRERISNGAPNITADLNIDIKGRQVLIIDDVLETGHSLALAKAHCLAAGAGDVLTCVFARKPKAAREIEADFIAWDAPDKFLVGYGMDDRGLYRGQPFISKVD